MPTKKREQSESGFYHVYQRGVCYFSIYENDEDRRFFVKRLTRYAKEVGATLHAWCLMGNHYHLLVQAGYEELSALMRKLNSVYARHFNACHDRIGPLFQGRFCSVCVETEEQLMTVVRYIHRNPIHHEESALCGAYPWTSYSEYIDGSQVTCKTELVLSCFDGLDDFVRFHEVPFEGERLVDIGSEGPLRDDEARKLADVALRKAGFEVPVSLIGSLPQEQRDFAIAFVKRSVNCSLRQMQRLTSIGYSVIWSAIKRMVGRALPFEEPESKPLVELLRSLSSDDRGPAAIERQTCRADADESAIGDLRSHCAFVELRLATPS